MVVVFSEGPEACHRLGDKWDDSRSLKLDVVDFGPDGHVGGSNASLRQGGGRRGSHCERERQPCPHDERLVPLKFLVMSIIVPFYSSRTVSVMVGRKRRGCAFSQQAADLASACATRTLTRVGLPWAL